MNAFERDTLARYYAGRRELWFARRAHPYSEEYETLVIFNRAVMTRRYAFEMLNIPIKSWVAAASDPYAHERIAWGKYTSSAESPERIFGTEHTSIITSERLHVALLNEIVESMRCSTKAHRSINHS